MKKITFLLGASLLLMTTSCESVSNLFKVKVDTQFDVNIPITADSQPMKSSAGYPFSGEETFNPLSVDELADYASRISSITLSDIVVTIMSVSGPFTILDATLTVAGQDSDGNDLSVEWTFENNNIIEGAILALVNTNNQLDTLSAILTGLSEVTVTFTGNVDTPGVTYDLFTQMFAQATVGL